MSDNYFPVQCQKGECAKKCTWPQWKEYLMYPLWMCSLMIAHWSTCWQVHIFAPMMNCTKCTLSHAEKKEFHWIFLEITYICWVWHTENFKAIFCMVSYLQMHKIWNFLSRSIPMSSPKSFLIEMEEGELCIPHWTVNEEWYLSCFDMLN